MEFLNREKAPISTEVWSVIDGELEELLAKRLKLRSVVDFDESFSFETDAIPTGKLAKISSKNGTTICAREPISMVEMRYDFDLPKTVIDEIKRGLEDFDNEVLQKAANEFAVAENSMILDGIKKANITGLLESMEHKPIAASSSKEMLAATAKALEIFDDSFVEGGFKIVVSNQTFSKLVVETVGAMSVKHKIEQLLGQNSIIVSNAVGNDKALVISQRGGDYKFYSGFDVSVGFEKENKDSISLFLTQSAAFRVLSPEASIVINIS
ncbi:MAG: family 1 encapsulin nanocompartment shell protein [Campylobacterales bacterium]